MFFSLKIVVNVNVLICITVRNSICALLCCRVTIPVPVGPVNHEKVQWIVDVSYISRCHNYMLH